MKIQLFQIDAFTDRCFSGNPAAVCPLSEWIDDSTLQSIASENNLSETAFLVTHPGSPGEITPTFEIRWFTPVAEVELCGHATLASSHALFQHLGVKAGEIRFVSRQSGTLGCRKVPDGYQLNFPVDPPREVEVPAWTESVLGARPESCWQGKHDLLAVFSDQDALAALDPDHAQLAKQSVRGLIATAPGKQSDVDFVSRFFAPALGIDEDPVTGSAHTVLTPYWHERLNAAEGDRLRARQVSRRGGQLACQLDGDRVNISGQAATYLVGEIEI